MSEIPQNETYRQYYIPPNFKEGTSVLGFMVKPLYLAQAVPFILVMILIVFIPLHSLSLMAKLVILGITCIPVIFLCITGINGDSVYRYIYNMIHFRKSRRVCLYNPRIKSEIKPLSEDPLSIQTLPREKVLMFMEKMKKEKAESVEEIDLDNLYFEDDEGIVEKPVEYMSSKELREYLRSQQ